MTYREDGSEIASFDLKTEKGLFNLGQGVRFAQKLSSDFAESHLKSGKSGLQPQGDSQLQRCFGVWYDDKSVRGLAHRCRYEVWIRECHLLDSGNQQIGYRNARLHA